VTSTHALVDRVRQRLVDAPGDLTEAIRLEAGGIVDDAVLARLQTDVAAQLIGLGPLEPLFQLDGMTDVLVNGPNSVWIDRGNGLEPAGVSFPDSGSVRALAQRLVTASGKRLDDAAPFADAVLADGTRVHAVLPPLTAEPTLSLRVFTHRKQRLGDLITADAISEEVADLLRAVVAARLTYVISGGTGAGKTTLLATMLAEVPHHERIVVVEDTAELAVDHPHVVGLATRAANVEGAGAIGLRDLVRQSLRMRPDRLVVGEFRGAEMVELLVALNTGHDGGAATMHANTSTAVGERLIALGGLAGLSRSAVVGLAGSALHVAVHVQRVGSRRSVSDIAVITREGDRLAVMTAWSSTAGLGAGADQLVRWLLERGVPVPAVLQWA